MGIWAWLILMVWGAFLATAAQVLFRGAKPNDYDWVYVAGGAVLGGFTAHVWYAGFGPVFDGLNVVQALAGGLAGALLAQLINRFLLRRRGIA